MNNRPSPLTRRQFLKYIAAGSGSAMATNLSAMRTALAQTDPADYKSLVCVFLFGGNDQWNTLVPFSNDRYDRYAQIRGDLALPQSDLLAIGSHALHPSLPQLQNLYGNGKLAFIRNIGNLIQTTRPADYFAKSVQLPSDLFSHNHQQETWQTNHAPVSGQSASGWGGRMADMFAADNESKTLPPSFSVFGHNYWQAGTTEFTQRPFDISPGGVGVFSHFNNDSWPPQESSRSARWQQILELSRDHALEVQAANMLLSTRSRLDAVRDKLEAAPELSTPFSKNNPLAQQLSMVARLIAVREALGLKRQLFMVGLGGFDTHGTQLASHSARLAQLDGALASFYNATKELKVSDSVVTFTASEFGRTLTSNGDGTDHAWSTDTIVMGDAVLGGQQHGEPVALYPPSQMTLSNTGEKLYGPTDVGSGRFIPHYSVEQYGATLGRWMGLHEQQLDLVFPRLKNFSRRDLGFLA